MYNKTEFKTTIYSLTSTTRLDSLLGVKDILVLILSVLQNRTKEIYREFILVPYNGTENWLECDMLCYQVAFAQNLILFAVLCVCGLCADVSGLFDNML